MPGSTKITESPTLIWGITRWEVVVVVGGFKQTMNRWFQSFRDNLQSWMQLSPELYCKRCSEVKVEKRWGGESKQQGAVWQRFELRNSAGHEGVSCRCYHGAKRGATMPAWGEGPVVTAN